MKPVVFERVANCLRNRFLSRNFLECLRSPFAGDNLVRHFLDSTRFHDLRQTDLSKNLSKRTQSLDTIKYLFYDGASKVMLIAKHSD